MNKENECLVFWSLFFPFPEFQVWYLACETSHVTQKSQETLLGRVTLLPRVTLDHVNITLVEGGGA